MNIGSITYFLKFSTITSTFFIVTMTSLILQNMAEFEHIFFSIIHNYEVEVWKLSFDSRAGLW